MIDLLIGLAFVALIAIPVIVAALQGAAGNQNTSDAEASVGKPDPPVRSEPH